MEDFKIVGSLIQPTFSGEVKSIEPSITGSAQLGVPPSGVTAYTDLTGKPKINGVELDGDKSLLELGIEPKRGMDDFYVTNAEKTGGLATGNATLTTVNKVADKAEKSVPLVTANTFSTLPAINTTSLVLVIDDETNDNQPTYYFHDGIKLNWIITQEA